MTWPVAAMMVLIGIITTLVLVSLVRQRGPADESGDADAGSGAADGALAASGDTPADAGVSWQRTLTDEPLYDLRVVGDTVVAAAPHTVMTLEVDGGTGTWRRPIDVGVLTDVAVTDKTVALRAATFRAVSLDAGTERWDKPDIVAPISSLAARDGVIYGIGPGRLSPELVALEASTGVPVWYYDGGAAAIADDATVAVDHGIVALLDDTGVAVIDPGSSTSVADDGRVAIDDARWRANVVDPWPGSLALLPDAIVVATRAGRVCAYDPADGALRWCMPVAGLAEQQPTLLVDGDTIVVVLESTVTALALESGLPRWTFEAQRALTPIAASTGREVVVSDVSGRAYGLDLDRGIQTWRASGFGEITALTATADAIYAGTRAGVIVRLQPPVDGVPS